MSTESTKIETRPVSYRLPVDVFDILGRWAEETGQTVTQVLSTCVRVAAEDEARLVLQKGLSEGESVLQDGEDLASVIQVRRPRVRDDLANAITLLLFESSRTIGERDQIGALGVARSRIYRGTPEYAKAGKAGKAGESPYEDEAALADELSSKEQADFGAMRQKGGK